MFKKQKFNFFKFANDAILPIRMFQKDSGYDLFSTETVSPQFRGLAYVKTGIGIEWGRIHNCHAHIMGRSSEVRNGYFVLPGVVDYGYSGELLVKVYMTERFKGIFEKDKIAQLVFLNTCIDDNYLSAYERGSNGFGSSGK